MKIGTDKINLLPKEYRQAEEIRGRLLTMISILILEVVLFIVWIVVPIKTEIQETNNQLETVSLELNDSRFMDINQVMRQLEEAKIERNQWTQKQAELKQENFVSRRLLDSLLSRLPLHLTVNKLLILPIKREASELEKTISIEGISREMISVLNYATILESIYGVGTTRYEATYDEKNNRYAYQISINILEETLETEEYIEEMDLVNDGGENW